MGNSEAFFYSAGSMIGLGFLSGGTFSQGTALNSSGQVVGFATDSMGNNRAFIYEDGTMYDLNDFVPLPCCIVLSDAEGITDSGQIIANSAEGHAYLLTPESETLVPEPSAATLLSLGLALLSFVRRRYSVD